MKETDRIEFKEQIGDGLEKEVVAFLNTKGGHIYIGIKDNGTIAGIDKADELQLKIKDRIINNIRPSVMGLFEVYVEEKDGKTIIVIGLAKGYEMPYYIKQKGRSEAGCFVRIGTSTQSMDEKTIEALLSKRLPCSLANMPSYDQELKFRQLEIYYAGIDKFLNKNFATNLHFYTPDKKYNQVADLFADKNGFSIRLAKWAGKDRIDLLQNEEYGYTCIISAMNSVLNRLNTENITQARKTATVRIEKRYVDEKALRETIINAFAHNDYSRGDTPIFEIFEDRFEITTYGDLLSWMTKKEFFSGISRPRNPEVMRVFKDLEFVENLGSGMPYVANILGKKNFLFTQNVIRISLMFNFEDENANETDPKIENVPNNVPNNVPENRGNAIIDLMREKPKITIPALSVLLHVNEKTIKRDVLKLKGNGLIERIGTSKNGYWKVNNKNA